MGEEERPDSGKEKKSGLARLSAMHVVIAMAVVILAVIFIAKFGFGMDLISPSSGEMAIVRKPVTPVPTLVQTPDVRPTVSFRPETLCPVGQTPCGSTCTNRMTDTENCGLCGKVCPVYNSTDRKCISAKCSNACLPGYYDCNQDMADGCESTLSDNDNCGACGKSCGSSGFCVLSHCQYDTAGPLTDPRPGVLH
jgi:hypothetical protein